MSALMIALAASLTMTAGAGAAPADEPREPLKVCFVSGSWEYESEESLTAFARELEERHPVRCTILQADSEDAFPGLEALDDCDVAVFYTRRLRIDGEPLQRVKDYVASGRPIVGIRTASHGFQNWLEMDPLVFGGNYRGHLRNDLTTEVSVAEGAEGDPILARFEPFTSRGSLYKVLPLAEDCRVLLVGTSPEGREPVAWTREVDGARVFYTSLGHQADFREGAFVGMLADAILWAAGREAGSP